MAYILHIDTSGSTGTIALAKEGAIISSVSTDEARNQASTINLMIDHVLQQGGIKTGQLEAIAVCGGPGSYTGLRIGLATAKGLCYALSIPLLMANKLSLLASNKQDLHKSAYPFYITLLTARTQEYFITVIDAVGAVILEPQHIMEADLQLQQFEQGYFVTDTAADTPNVFNENTIIDNGVSIDANYWAKAAKESFFLKKFTNIATAEPFYLKEVYTHK
ncbi:MAG: tRNA (adenosine(37)-N6)-threonylcarbamoyltransferase complex dimerization subunit type 1 TsaB [Flavipsychrobacter sp.]|nr:tRNA (adenosine(37)-N6)-threonylcarbamoyltransferase complex dimerization subunit type 1 TsaB [Flavipsychrobacter sp.]